VAKAREMTEAAGRRVASVAEARELLGTPRRASTTERAGPDASTAADA
jgi:hypothetical protein